MTLAVKTSSRFCSCVNIYACVRAGQSLTSVKVKAGEALRLHKTSVGEEAQEEEEEQEGEMKRQEGEEDSSDPVESNSHSAAAQSRGVFSTITHAVQNTVSIGTCIQIHTPELIIKFQSQTGN